MIYKLCRGRKLVPSRPNGNDESRMVRIGFDLGAQVGYVHLYEMKTVLIVRPNLAAKLLPSKHQIG